MPPSAKRLAERFLQRSAGLATDEPNGRFASMAWVAGVRAGKLTRGCGLMPNPPEARPEDFYEGYTWGYINAPKIREVD